MGEGRHTPTLVGIHTPAEADDRLDVEGSGKLVSEAAVGELDGDFLDFFAAVEGF